MLISKDDEMMLRGKSGCGDRNLSFLTRSSFISLAEENANALINALKFSSKNF